MSTINRKHYFYILKNGLGEVDFGFCYHPDAILKTYREGKSKPAKMSAPQLAELFFTAAYSRRDCGKLYQFFKKLSDVELGYYAKQSPATLKTWFLSICKLTTAEEIEKRETLESYKPNKKPLNLEDLF